MKKIKKSVKQEQVYTVTFPWGETMKIGPGINNAQISHEGVPAKIFSKALAKAARVVSDAGIFDSEKNVYGDNYKRAR